MMEGAVVGIEHKSWAGGRPLLLWQSLPQVYYLLQWTAVKHLIVAVTRCLLSKRITTVHTSIPRREPVSRRFDALTMSRDYLSHSAATGACSSDQDLGGTCPKQPVSSSMPTPPLWIWDDNHGVDSSLSLSEGLAIGLNYPYQS